MARKKVETTSDISSQDVFDVLNFAQQLYSGQFGGIYTPQLTNARMQDITMSPQIATSAKIDTALNDPKNYEQQLIGYTEWMELSSMMFKRVLGYFSGLMSWDWNYVCTNAKATDYTSSAYEKDLNIVREFTDRFDAKKEFSVVMKEMMRNEAYFGILRDDGQVNLLQELPQSYCIITGRHDYGLLFDFNMVYFLQPTVKLDLFPEIFTRMYNEIFYKNGQPVIYDPASNLYNRSGTYAMWHQTSPIDGFTCFKIAPELATRVPWLSPLLPSAVLEPVIRGLQTNSYIQQASKLILGEVPYNKESQAKLKDNLAINSDLLGKFMALIQAAMPTAIKMAAVPLQNTSALEFTGSDTILNSYLQTMAASSGTNSRLLYSIDRQNVLETKLSVDIDMNVLRMVYPQFQDFMNFHINRRTKKFKFKILYEGFNIALNRDERLATANTLADSGMVIDQKFASAIGVSPFDFRRMLEETKASKFVDKLTPILKANQMSGDMKGSGRPTKDEDDLSDGGADTKASGNNIGKVSK